MIGSRREDYVTDKYQDNSKVGQEELKVSRWIDVRDMPEWKRISAAGKCRIECLRNRINGYFPADQQNFDYCSLMFKS